MVRQSAAVYRRRRLVALVTLVLILALLATGVWAAIAQPWQGKSAPASSATPTAESTEAAPSPAQTTPPPAAATDAPTPAPTPTDGVAPCAEADIDVVAVTDQDSYAAGQLPQLSISLTNRGSKDCTMDVGTATQLFTVTSGTDVWWRSTDCQSDPSNQVVTLAAGKTVASAKPIEWDRTRSGVDQCESTNRQVAPAAGASYHFAAAIGGFESKKSKQIILQ